MFAHEEYDVGNDALIIDESIVINMFLIPLYTASELLTNSSLILT